MSLDEKFGVWRRSKACRTCYKRRRKCDETRPECLRCVRLGLTCEGYVSRYQFVYPAPQPVSRAYARWTAIPPSALDDNSTAEMILVERQSQDVPPLHLTEMNLSAFQDDMFIAFTRKNLFSGVLIGDPWMWDLVFSAPETSSHHAIRALSAAFFGNVNRQAEARQKALVEYGKALQYLAKELSSELAWDEETLKSTMTLVWFEMVAFTTSRGWLKHAGGIGHFIEMRGPWRHQTGNHHVIFELSRTTVILDGIVNRKRVFLEEEVWKTIPWALNPASKTSLNFLQDIFADIPGLLERADALKSQRSQAEQMREYTALCNDTIKHIHSTHLWRIQWEKENPIACWEVPSKIRFLIDLDSDTGNPRFPRVFWFQSLHQANEINLYDSVLLILIKLASELMRDFTPVAPKHALPTFEKRNPLYVPGDQYDSRALALELCRTVEYQLLDEHKGAGSFYLLFPLQVAYRILGGPSTKEGRWVDGMLKVVSEGYGFELSRKLPSTLPDSGANPVTRRS